MIEFMRSGVLVVLLVPTSTSSSLRAEAFSHHASSQRHHAQSQQHRTASSLSVGVRMRQHHQRNTEIIDKTTRTAIHMKDGNFLHGDDGTDSVNGDTDGNSGTTAINSPQSVPSSSIVDHPIGINDSDTSTAVAVNNTATLSSCIDTATTTTTTTATSSAIRLQYAAYDMICAAIVGVVTGVVVATFKLSIETVRVVTYSFPLLDYLHNEIGAILIPVLGGCLVGILIASGPFSPGLRGKVSQVEAISASSSSTTSSYEDSITQRISQQVPILRKTAAAICTLGTGCSLGPEGPCVELGMGISRSIMDLFHRRPLQQQQHHHQPSVDVVVAAMSQSTWNRMLLSCGAAAGVSAGFDAPVAGVFFALEVMQSAFNDVGVKRFRQQQQQQQQVNDQEPVVVNSISVDSGGLFSSSATLSPVLLSSVLAALCSRSILGDHLTFNVANMETLSASPLIELPMFLLLGSICGVVAFLFSQSAKFSRSCFQGEIGNEMIRTIMQSISPSQKPIIGGLFCGATALYYPQILFFGYETLNSLLSNTVSVPTNVLLSLLLAKGIATAVSIGSGLVGGTLAPALFLGGVTGASFHNIMCDLYQFVAVHVTHSSPTDHSVLAMPMTLGIADLPDYAMVGSASVLAALFRAPLTASLLLFELSRDYDVILPIIASAGVGSVVADIFEDAFIMNTETQK